MAGIGKRMRPHTLSIPKPLIRIAGKPIVQRLVEDIAKVCHEKIEEIAFIIGDFGKEVEANLMEIARSTGAEGKIYYQQEPLGTAHAILCAKDSMKGKIIIAFADTLFKADFKLDQTRDGIIWVHQVENPQSFGVVTTDSDNNIINFTEKPQKFVSDLAIIGIYYFKDAGILEKELQQLIDNNVQTKGEFQITDALQNMMKKGMKFTTGKVDEWLDCGNKDATVYTNQRILEFNKNNGLTDSSAKIIKSIIIEPCFLGKNVIIENSIIGPYVSVEANSHIEKSVISNSIIQTNSKISCINIDNSMIGNYVEYIKTPNEVSIGDYTILT